MTTAVKPPRSKKSSSTLSPYWKPGFTLADLCFRQTRYTAPIDPFPSPPFILRSAPRPGAFRREPVQGSLFFFRMPALHPTCRRLNSATSLYDQIFLLPVALNSGLDKNLPQQLIHTEKSPSRRPTFVFNKTPDRCPIQMTNHLSGSLRSPLTMAISQPIRRQGTRKTSRKNKTFQNRKPVARRRQNQNLTTHDWPD
jgi:hypothetical protein